jgi:hypothetical protein
MTITRTRLAKCALGVFTATLLGTAVCSGPAAYAASAAAQSPATTTSASHPCGTVSKPGTYKHVIWIWLENLSR